ncbi:MAG: polyhydroxyalkanoate biosynthesis repressor PhaR [Proteobacteria bacterium]|nr:polyhydroxyalkanoate biosynthesis repressor PhaR [Pseudomonadota bacterium]
MIRLIKKYKNRRLYDTEKSQYINVEELAQYVVEGIAFKVEDASTGKDLTNNTLLQIFVEMESGSSQFLSADMLRQLIILAHHPMSKSFKTMLGQMFTNIETSIDSNSFINDYKKATELWSGKMDELSKQWQEYFKK